MSVREEDKTGLQEGRESYDIENHDDGKPVEGDQEGTGTRCRSIVRYSLLTDVRDNQNMACMRYCRADR